MEWKRLTGVTGEGGPGSGYVVAPRLVLTSAHVVGGRCAMARVFQPGCEGVFKGRVVWCGTPEGRDDAALVAIDDPDWTPVHGATVRWGMTATHRPGLRCECWGVPDVMQRPGYPVDTAQLTGRLNPGDWMVSDRYSIWLDGHPPATREDGRSPWGGLSGAAVFCSDPLGNDLLVGVIAIDAVPFGHSVLAAVPAYVLHHDPECRAVLAVHSLATVIEAAELTKLASPEPDPQPQGAVVSPAKLLTAQRAVVGFHGRAELLEQLRTWAQQPGVGVCLVYGPGGQGKTRLARHFGEQFAHGAAGGIVLWLDRTAPAGNLSVIADTVVPVLIVVDYAESRPRQLTALLTALSTCRRPPAVKVMALARTAGDWWDRLADTSDAVADLMEAATVTALPVLDATETARRDSYRAAVAAFAEELARLPAHSDTDWSARAAALVDRPLPSTTAAWTVLAIQMTALADLLDAATESSRLDGKRLEATESGRGAERDKSPEERVIRHERRYWKNTAEAAEVPLALSRDTLSDIVAATILLPPPMPEQVNDWLARIPELSNQPLELRGRVRAWLAGLYPAVGPYAFGQLEPDRLGEHLIGTLIADQSRVSIAETLAAHVDGEDATQWVSICARAAAHPGLGDRVGGLLTRLFEKYPATVAVAALHVAPGLEAPEPLVHAMECLVRNPATPTASLVSIDRALSHYSLLWSDTAAELSAVLVARCQPEEPDGHSHAPQDQADLTKLVNETSGRLQDMVKSMGMRFDWSRSDRAWHLFNLAARLADAGRRKEALAASTEAVQMFRRLAEGSGSRESHPRGQVADQQVGLAKSLANHSNRLVDAGRREEALAAIAEAVQIFRQLVEGGQNTFLPDLAGSLNNYSVQLADAGRRREALAPSVEAVQIYRGLVEAGQDALLHNFVMSLGNHFNQLTDSGRREEVLAETTEAVQILRRRAEARPDALLPDVAKSLTCLSNQFATLGRQERALEATTEVVQIYRQLAEARPDAFLPDLAGNLHNLAMALTGLGRWGDGNGLDAITEAVIIRRQLAEALPDTFRPDFARSLNDRAIWLRVWGRREEALDSINEAITIRRQLAETLPAVYQRELNQSLHVLAVLQDERR